MKKAVWRVVEDGSWKFHAPGYAVFGTVAQDPEDPKMWVWSARVMWACSRNSINGRAYDFDSAQRIVETLCVETKTLALNHTLLLAREDVEVSKKKAKTPSVPIHFSVNLHDRDGDVYDTGIFLFVGDRTILKFNDISELESFAFDVKYLIPEIREEISHS